MSTGGLSRARLARVHDVMAGYVERGEVPGLVTAISRRGELRVDAIGFGMGIDTKRTDLSSVPGRFGWVGGVGTAGASDPKEDLVGIPLTQRMLESPILPGFMADFWTSAYHAIED